MRFTFNHRSTHSKTRCFDTCETIKQNLIGSFSGFSFSVEALLIAIFEFFEIIRCRVQREGKCPINDSMTYRI